MPTLQVEHSVRDYDAWKVAFDRDPVGREQGGVRRYRISRPVGEPNHVVIDLEFDELRRAEEFRELLQDLWVRAAADHGLGNPRARILDTVESTEY